MGEQARKSMGELALKFICCAVAQARNRYPSPHLIPHHLRLAGELGPEVTRAGELVLSLTSCNTWESWPCTSSSNIIKLSSLTWVWAGQPQGHENKRVGSAPCKLWHLVS